MLIVEVNWKKIEIKPNGIQMEDVLKKIAEDFEKEFQKELFEEPNCDDVVEVTKKVKECFRATNGDITENKKENKKDFDSRIEALEKIEKELEGRKIHIKQEAENIQKEIKKIRIERAGILYEKIKFENR